MERLGTVEEIRQTATKELFANAVCKIGSKLEVAQLSMCALHSAGPASHVQRAFRHCQCTRGETCVARSANSPGFALKRVGVKHSA